MASASSVPATTITTAKVTADERTALEAAPGVAAVEEDVIVTADRIAIDPGYAAADGLRDIAADDAWDTTTGAPASWRSSTPASTMAPTSCDAVAAPTPPE